MTALDFEIDWVDAEGIRGPELSATWAALRIRASDSVITRVLDERAKTVRDFVHVPLYPLAEWLAANWWFLGHEYENPEKRTEAGFRRRHDLTAGREGYAFPSLEIISCGALTRLAWRRDSSPWTKVTFLEQGENWIDSSEFRASCAGLIDAVVRRLDSLGIEGTFLQQEWSAIQDADKEEIAFCKTAAGLGWDPYALDDVGRNCVLSLADKLGEVLVEAVPALDTENPDADCSAILDAMTKARHNRLALERVRSFHEKSLVLAGTESNPWEAGYRLARHLRQNLGLHEEPLANVETMAAALGEDAKEIQKATTPVSFNASKLIDAVIVLDDEKNPAFAFRRLGEHSRRFHFCRALAEVLMSPGSDTLLTKAHSERQKRNRAFAAEFLAPSQGLQQRIRRNVVDSDDMSEMAAEFGVSPLLIEHQIRNHRIADIWDDQEGVQSIQGG